MAPKMPSEFQGIMAFFVLWKVILHFFDDEWVPIVSKGYLGEDCLFILNGFIFALATLEVKNKLTPKTYINHISKVLVHIYPLLIISELSIYYYFNHTGQEDRCTLKDMFDHLTFTQVWSNPNTCNSGAWALSVEWVGYAIFPFLHALLKNKKTYHYVLVAVVVYLALVLGGHHQGWVHLNNKYGSEVMIRFFTQSIIGFCLGNIYTLNKKGSIVYDFLTIASISLTLQFSQTSSDDIFLVIFISALPYCLIKSLYQKQLFSIEPVKKVGEISITVLLTHGLVAEYAHHGHWQHTASNFFLYLWLCYIQGYLVHRFFEVPLDKLVHTLTSFGANDYPYEPNGEVRHDEPAPELNMAASEIIRQEVSANNSLGKEKTD